jgi:hypothetical protein
MDNNFHAFILWVGLGLSIMLGGVSRAADAPVVPEGMIRVAILGQLNKPGFKLLPAGASLDQLFAAAGGLPGDSELDEDNGWPPVTCKVTRIAESGEKEIFRLRIKIDPKTRVITTEGKSFEVRTGDVVIMSERVLP